jgi:Alpha-L-arabinofuranosidase B (ABFB) domain
MTYHSFQSFNFPTRWIRHQNFLGELTELQGAPGSNSLDHQDATFYIFGGTPNFGSHVHLQAINNMDHVLRHKDFRIRLDPFIGVLHGGNETPENKQLRDDCTFILHRGLANPALNFVSFESFNFLGRFIRHRDRHLFLEPADSDLAKTDATFFWQNPLASSNVFN